jgi:hypothetical protein
MHVHRDRTLLRRIMTLNGQMQGGERAARLACLHFARERRLSPEKLETTMNNKWKSSALVLGLVLVLGVPAYAHDHHGGNPPSGGGSGAAPEVDPGLAVAGISFLAGSLAVLRSRLRK